MGLPRGFSRCWRVATADTGFMPATPQSKSAVATIDFAEGAKHTGLTWRRVRPRRRVGAGGADYSPILGTLKLINAATAASMSGAASAGRFS